MVGALQERHTNRILTFLLSHEQIKKTDLLEIVSSSDSLSNTLRKLQEEGLILMETKVIGRKIINVSLTPKGRSVAEQLKKAEDVAKGEPIQISDQEARDWAEKFRDATKGLSLLYHVNVFDNHVTIAHEKDGKLRVLNVYVRVNGRGVMRLWCEEDESFECIHVQYAWTLPKVQEMYANNLRNGEVRGK